MAVHYFCRHCGTNVGSLERSDVSAEQIGLHKLTEDERREMVQYHQNGDMEIKTICEDCHESLERYPDYHQNDYLIH
ncbi:MAG TPA: anti-sigma-F factor Fin family protein [Chondromyces sp.]|nr:anti-sigma-F factor Fin family protein [Chondromyces sp.]